MAAQDLNKLQQILQNAESNELQLAAIRKQFDKVAGAVRELSNMLDPSFTAARKSRKAVNSTSTGSGRRGRPKKSEPAE